MLVLAIGTTRMKGLARAHFWCPGLDKDIEGLDKDIEGKGLDKNIEGLAKSSQQCQSVKQAPPAAPMHP